MYDGARRNESFLICTENFTFYEVVQIMSILRIKFRLECTMHLDNVIL